MQYAGLHVMWIESDLLGENTTEHVMAGKDYIYAKAKGTLPHKITIQAMWQLFLQQLIELVSEWTGRATCVKRCAIYNLPLLLHLPNELSSRTGRWSQAASRESCPLWCNNREWWACHTLNNISISWTYVNVLEKNKGINPHFHFWWQYMQMVGVRLLFIRVKRDDIWYLNSFEQMVPYFSSKGIRRHIQPVDPDHSEEWLNAKWTKAGGIVGITK